MSMIHRAFHCFLFTACLSGTVVADENVNGAENASVSFIGQVRPILSDKCFSCHGPDERTREADLRLDVLESGVDSGAIVPGKPDESEMLRRLLLPVGDDERMPPPQTHKEVSPEEIATIRAWIADGARYEQHWSYRPLLRPTVPAIDQPTGAGPIDAFILAALKTQRLQSAPPADRVALARRLHFDLLGMPPSYEEVRQFVEDKSPDAVESLVDRLLRDARFGERMAVFWLDLVRYADTIGYHSDTSMEVSAYRDYVIDAFNSNMPFDQFTIEQLAGDLLPQPTQQQRIASGYNRLLQTTEEGGAQAKEYLAIYAADRVRNVSGVWMGQTMGCAQCHDHKYDPITTKDFYSLAAFFADIKENVVGKRNPNLKLISPEQQARIESLTKEIDRLQPLRMVASDNDLAARLQAGQAAWEAKTLASDRVQTSLWQTPKPIRVEATGGVELKSQSDGSWLSSGKNPATGTYTLHAGNHGDDRGDSTRSVSRRKLSE